ncbi:hypothetical protein IRJ41_011487 [Triplophysa rosa]|uniref:Uncharacterized protein n=1 Tax=Triplophysa rosa TaxID=992332 RepID=A0A9W7TSC8_TRIRA|nr:hypothetical protein IRJ41_011487 [Triplophysa rosa]
MNKPNRPLKHSKLYPPVTLRPATLGFSVSLTLVGPHYSKEMLQVKGLEPRRQ